jgi:hypothetical protein
MNAVFSWEVACAMLTHALASSSHRIVAILYVYQLRGVTAAVASLESGSCSNECEDKAAFSDEFGS